MAFKQLNNFETHIDLPHPSGKTYRIESPDALTGLYCQGILKAAAAVKDAEAAGEEPPEDLLAGLELDDEAEADFNRRLLGTAMPLMLADRVQWEFVKLCASTTFLWVVQNKDAAEAWWARGGRPEASRPAPKDRQPAKKLAAKKTTTPST